MIQWYKVFDSLEEAQAELPLRGTMQLEAGGRRVCLARTQDGFFAIDDACPHFGASLSSGTLNNLNEVVCPWHSYRFHLKTGEECAGRAAAGNTHTIEHREEGVFLGIDT